MYLRGKGPQHFLLCNPTDACVIFIKGDIFELVQITENTDFAEFCNARYKDKLQVFFITFESTEKAFVHCFVVIFTLLVPERLQKGLVVFIDKDDAAFSLRFSSCF